MWLKNEILPQIFEAQVFCDGRALFQTAAIASLVIFAALATAAHFAVDRPRPPAVVNKGMDGAVPEMRHVAITAAAQLATHAVVQLSEPVIAVAIRIKFAATMAPL